jgi:hypothetical protein
MMTLIRLRTSVWRVHLSHPAGPFFARQRRLDERAGAKERGDFLEDAWHAQGGINGGVDFVMMRARVHDQNLGCGVRLPDHVRQVMAIVLGERGAEDDEIKSFAAQGFEDALPVKGGGHLMTNFGHLGGLSPQSSFVGLAVENPDSLMLGGLVCGFLCARGQRTLLELTRSLATAGQGSEVTEDQGPRDAIQWG